MQTHCSHAWPCRALQRVPGKFLTAHMWLLELFRTVHQCYEQNASFSLYHHRRPQPRKAEGQGSAQVCGHMGILHTPTCSAMAFWDATSQESGVRNTTELSLTLVRHKSPALDLTRTPRQFSHPLWQLLHYFLRAQILSTCFKDNLLAIQFVSLGNQGRPSTSSSFPAFVVVKTPQSC